MTQLHLSKWNTQFTSRGVIEEIRRKICGRIADGSCVVVYDAGTHGLTPELKARIRQGFPETKVRFSLPYPEQVESGW